MFITVRYGENQTKIFNTNCKNSVLLQFIRARCQVDDEVELSDESGVVKNLRSYPSNYAVEHLSDREILILLKVNESNGIDGEGIERKTYVPALAGFDKDPHFLKTLNPKHITSQDESMKSARKLKTNIMKSKLAATLKVKNLKEKL